MHPSEWDIPGRNCLRLCGGNQPRALTEASGHVTTVYVLPQFHSLRKKKGFHDR